MNKRLCQHLQKLARQRKVTYYGQVAPMVGLNMAIPAHRRKIGWVLDAVSDAEKKKRRPLLSAIVVRSDTKRPGIGFFEMAKRLKVQRGRIGDVAFFERERERVWGYWSRAKHA